MALNQFLTTFLFHGFLFFFGEGGGIKSGFEYNIELKVCKFVKITLFNKFLKFLMDIVAKCGQNVFFSLIKESNDFVKRQLHKISNVTYVYTVLYEPLGLDSGYSFSTIIETNV